MVGMMCRDANGTRLQTLPCHASLPGQSHSANNRHAAEPLPAHPPPHRSRARHCPAHYVVGNHRRQELLAHHLCRLLHALALQQRDREVEL